MQRATFSRARKILGMRILPRAPTLQTYLFWPIGVNQRRELAQYSSCTAPIPDFFGAAAMQRHTFSRARKKNWILSGCRKSVCCILDFLLMVVCEQQGPLLRRRRRVDRHRFDGERGDERRERLLARHRAASCPSDAAPVRPASRGVLSRPASRVGGAPGARGARATRAHARRV